MQKKDCLLLDNIGYADYFLAELKHRYIPVAYSAYIRSFLEKERGISAIGIFDYLPNKEIDKITREASELVDKSIVWFDENNRKVYGQIFGRQDINFFYVSMNYLFKRFVVGSFRLIKGLEAITEHESIASLNYPHNGNPIDLCGNSRENAFFFPDNITWKLLESWNYNKKPPILALKVNLTANNPCRHKNAYKFEYLMNKIKVFYRALRHYAKKRHEAMLPYSAGKKNILFMKPLYDLDFVASSNEIKEKFNLIFWDIDNNMNPEFLQKQPISDFFLDKDGHKKNEGEFNLHELNFDNEILKNNDNNAINLYSYLVPLIKRFYERKMPNILNYWKAAKELHNTTAIDMVCWGNPPHRYPAGIVNEFFRLNNVPRFGMQHGGVYGSNYMGQAFYDLDLNHCDYYFSYGFGRDVIERRYPAEKKIPVVIPVGSVAISDFAKSYNSKGNKNKHVNILYLIGVTFENIFFASEFTIPSIYKLQTKIIDKLASFPKCRIVLKFLCGTYDNHYLKQYIEARYPDKFTVIDNISFKKSLEIYNPDLVLIEQQSTPLNESLVTKSHILVYNDSMFLSLTDEAAFLLQKRAIVCNTIEDFLNKVEDFMKGRREIKDLNNTEFMEKYCVYKGDPKDNITRALMKSYDKAN
jgi:hypothetical protein